MSDNLHLRWKRACDDWVSSIAAIPGELIAYGTRDGGSVTLLDWLGAELASFPMNSRVGALSIAQVHGAQVIVAGTKSGKVEGLEFGRETSRRLTPFWTMNFNNTVRSIDALSDAAAGNLIAIGSEDKTVRCFRLEDGAAQIVTEAFTQRPNGWIRAVAFGEHGPNGRAFLGAGCGDKHVHVFGLDGMPLGKTYVGAKTHWIAADRSDSRLYVVTDALELLVLDTSRSDFRIRSRTKCPFRPLICLNFEAPNQFVLLICEQGKILSFDPRSETLNAAAEMNDLVTAACVAGDGRGAAVLLGTASGSVGLYDIDIDAKPIQLSEPFSPLSIRPGASDFDDYTRALVEGPVSSGIPVGICRFIEVVAGQEGLCAVLGTDEGAVLVIDVADLLDDEKIRARFEFPLERVWSVAGAWAEGGALRVWTGTSDRTVREFLVTVPPGAKPGSTDLFQQRWEWRLDDWPREIRLVMGGDAGEICAACENGEVAILRDGELLASFNLGQTLRTILCRKTARGYDFLIGSDQGDVIALAGETEQWRVHCDDRVREIQEIDGGYAIASEDRFVTLTDERGCILHRLRLPHRVLCVECWRNPAGERIVYAGCGDGWVYSIKSNGAIGVAYRFPDRIRDIKLLTAGDFLVASEDRRLYLAEELGSHMEREHGREEEGLILASIEALETAYSGSGTRSFAALEDNALFALLATTHIWLGTERRLAVAADLVSHASRRMAPYGELRKLYILGAAIADIGGRFDPALALAKLKSFPHPEQASYLLHAVITRLDERGTTRGGRGGATLQHAVEALDQQHHWVWKECAALLVRRGWSEIGAGFLEFFLSAPIHFTRLDRMVEVAIGISRDWSLPQTTSLDIRTLRAFEMTLPQIAETVAALGLGRIAMEAPLVGGDDSLVARLRRMIGPVDTTISLLSSWFDLVEQASSSGAAAVLPVLVDHLKMSLARADPLITSRDYVIIMLFASIVSLHHKEGISS